MDILSGRTRRPTLEHYRKPYIPYQRNQVMASVTNQLAQQQAEQFSGMCRSVYPSADHLKNTLSSTIRSGI